MIDMNQINLQGWVSPLAPPKKKKKQPWEQNATDTQGVTGASAGDALGGYGGGATTTTGAGDTPNPYDAPNDPWGVTPVGPGGTGYQVPKAAEYTDWASGINPEFLPDDLKWLRDPSWHISDKDWTYAGGGTGTHFGQGESAGVIWDPVFGYQTRDDLIGALRKAMQGRNTQMTQQEWTKLGKQYGLKNNARVASPYEVEGWSKWSGGSSPGGGAGGGGGDYWSQLLALLGGDYDTLSGNAKYPKLPDEDNTQAWDAFLKYPTQWETASDVMSAFAKHGYPTQNPEAWKKAEDVATSFADTGLPVDQDPMYRKSFAVAQRDIMDAINQANEQAGLTGTRWSTPLGRTAQDIAGRRMETLGAENMRNVMGAQEAGRGRQMTATNQLMDIGSNIAGLSEAAKARGLGAAGGLAGLGQQYVNYPMQLAQQAYGMGTAETAQQQAQIDKILQEYQRLMPENSPWLKFLQSSLGLGASSVGDFMNTGGSNNFMNVLIGLLGGIGSIVPG